MLLVEPVVRLMLVEWEAEKAAIAVELERAEVARSRAARTKRRNEAEQRYRAFLEGSDLRPHLSELSPLFGAQVGDLCREPRVEGGGFRLHPVHSPGTRRPP